MLLTAFWSAGRTHMDLRFACKEYDEHFGKDMMVFKKAVESELAYDV